MKDKRPSFQFYPGDWRKDPELSRATKAEKGLLIDLMCLMWECEERGIMATSGKAWSDEDISFAAGGDRSENLLLISELLRKGILRRNQTGAIFSKRMVHDEHKRLLCVKAGELGGNPTLKGMDKGKDKHDANPNPTPSSSVSSSASASKNKSHVVAVGIGGLQGGKVKGNDFSTDQENQEAVDDAVDFSGDEGSRAFFQKAVKALGPGLVREAVGEVKMRGDFVSSKSKYLTTLLSEWMRARAGRA